MSNLSYMEKSEGHKKMKKEEKVECNKKEEDNKEEKEEIKKELDFNLDLENMEKMLFAKINSNN